MSEKLLIVIDMLNDFCDEKGALAKSIITGEFYAKPIIEPVRQLVSTYRDQNIPIAWLCDAHAKDDLEFDRFPPHAIKGTWGAQIIDVLGEGAVPGNEITIEKTRYSGFYGTALEYYLISIGVKQVEVCGVCTSICVMDTVGGLANRDYQVNISKACVADFDPAAHDAALARMAGLYGATIL